MIALLLQLIVAVIIIGFVYWAYTLLIPMLPLPAPFRQLLDALILILVVAVLLFYFLLPLIQQLGHLLPGR
jgi:hypothetical protein